MTLLDLSLASIERCVSLNKLNEQNSFRPRSYSHELFMKVYADLCIAWDENMEAVDEVRERLEK